MGNAVIGISVKKCVACDTDPFGIHLETLVESKVPEGGFTKPSPGSRNVALENCHKPY